MLRLRVLTAGVLLPLLLAGMFLLPATGWQIALAVPLLIAGHEWSRLAGHGRAMEALFLFLLVAGYACALALSRPAGVQVEVRTAVAHTVYAAGLAFWLVIAPLWLWLKMHVRSRPASAAAGMLVLLPAWLAAASLQRNAGLLLELMAVVWIADTAAYFAGRAYGTRRLAPAVSPGKTWEGVGGAFAGVTVYALVLNFARAPADDFAIVLAAFCGMTALSIVGDLFESWLKRSAGVKDSGTLLPGHGGVLDRVDGMVAALPLAALMFT